MTPTLISMRPNLPVRDVPTAIAFYRDTLGFEVKAEFPDGSFALLESGGAELALVRHESPQSQGAYLYVTGVEELLARCISAGHTITSPLTTQPWGLRDFVVLDPDGHAIAIGERMG